jgi:hypothetical protein
MWAFSLSTVETFFRGYCVSYHPDQFSAQSSNWNPFSFNGREIGLRCDGVIRLDNFCTPLSSVLTSFAGVPWAENLVLLYRLCTTRRFVSRSVLSFQIVMRFTVVRYFISYLDGMWIGSGDGMYWVRDASGIAAVGIDQW